MRRILVRNGHVYFKPAPVLGMLVPLPDWILADGPTFSEYLRGHMPYGGYIVPKKFRDQLFRAVLR